MAPKKPKIKQSYDASSDVLNFIIDKKENEKYFKKADQSHHAGPFIGDMKRSGASTYTFNTTDLNAIAKKIIEKTAYQLVLDQFILYCNKNYQPEKIILFFQKYTTIPFNLSTFIQELESLDPSKGLVEFLKKSLKNIIEIESKNNPYNLFNLSSDPLMSPHQQTISDICMEEWRDLWLRSFSENDLINLFEEKCGDIQRKPTIPAGSTPDQIKKIKIDFILENIALQGHFGGAINVICNNFNFLGTEIIPISPPNLLINHATLISGKGKVRCESKTLFYAVFFKNENQENCYRLRKKDGTFEDLPAGHDFSTIDLNDYKPMCTVESSVDFHHPLYGTTNYIKVSYDKGSGLTIKDKKLILKEPSPFKKKLSEGWGRFKENVSAGSMLRSIFKWKDNESASNYFDGNLLTPMVTAFLLPVQAALYPLLKAEKAAEGKSWPLRILGSIGTTVAAFAYSAARVGSGALLFIPAEIINVVASAALAVFKKDSISAEDYADYGKIGERDTDRGEIYDAGLTAGHFLWKTVPLLIVRDIPSYIGSKIVSLFKSKKKLITDDNDKFSDEKDTAEPVGSEPDDFTHSRTSSTSLLLSRNTSLRSVSLYSRSSSGTDDAPEESAALIITGDNEDEDEDEDADEIDDTVSQEGEEATTPKSSGFFSWFGFGKKPEKPKTPPSQPISMEEITADSFRNPEDVDEPFLKSLSTNFCLNADQPNPRIISAETRDSMPYLLPDASLFRSYEFSFQEEGHNIKFAISIPIDPANKKTKMHLPDLSKCTPKELTIYAQHIMQTARTHRASHNGYNVLKWKVENKPLELIVSRINGEDDNGFDLRFNTSSTLKRQ